MTAPTGINPRSRTALHRTLGWARPAIPAGAARLADQVALAARRMWRNRAVTALVVVSLSLGVGANTAVFSLIDLLFLEPLPFHEPHRLVGVRTTDPKNAGTMGISYPNFEDLRAGAHSFQELVAASGLRVNAGEGGSVTETAAELVSPNYFQVLGVGPSLGRVFSPASIEEKNEATHRVAVISHAFWRQRFASDPAAIGRTLSINGMTFGVVAVAPAGFRGIDRLDATDLWLPMANYAALAERPTWLNSRRALMFMAFARLGPSADAAGANREIGLIGRRLAAQYPEPNAGRSFETYPLADLLMEPEHRARLMTGATVALFAAGLVLLIAIANASNVLLGHSAGRRREMALRLAMGARRRDFFSQILLESLLLVAAGGTLGLLAGVAGREILWGLRPDDMLPNEMGLSLNWRVVGFSLALSAIAGALANLLPVLQTLRGDLGGELKPKAAAPGAEICRRTAGYVVVAQVALSLMALVGADLFLRRHRSVRQIDPGFDARAMALAEVSPRRLGMAPADQPAFYARLVERLEKLPGVRSAAVASDPVFGFHGLQRTVRLDTTKASQPARFVHVTSVSTLYFETTDILVLRGRAFQDSDAGGQAMAAIVNEQMGREFWGTESPLGKRFRLFAEQQDRVVVGVARDSAFGDLGAARPEALVYVPVGLETPSATLHVRTEVDPAMLREAIASSIREAAPGLPAAEVKTISEIMDRALWGPRMAAGLLTAFGLIAMLLAALGVYGVTSHLVSQRVTEIGVRMAMGASPVDVKHLVLKQTAALIVPGLVIGSVLAFVLAQVVRATLIPSSGADVEPYVTAPLLLAASAFCASYLPARRAVKLPPATAVRQE